MANETRIDYLALLRYQIDEASKRRFDESIADSKKRVDSLGQSLKTVGEAMKKVGVQAAGKLNVLPAGNAGTGINMQSLGMDGSYQQVLNNLGIDLESSAQKMQGFSAEFDKLKAVGNGVLMELNGRLADDLAPLLDEANDGVVQLSEAFADLSPETQDVIKQIGAMGLGVVKLLNLLSSLKKAASVLTGSPLTALAGLAAGSFLADAAMTKKRADSVMEANTGGDYVGLLFNGVDAKRAADKPQTAAVPETEKQAAVATPAEKVRRQSGSRSRPVRNNQSARSRPVRDSQSARSRQVNGRNTAAGGTSGNGRLSKADVMQFFMSKNWTKEQAAGITANLWSESKFDPKIVGDNGQAIGMAQWHPPRQKIFKKLFGKDIRQSSAMEQLEFVQYELTHSEKNAGNRLKNARTARDAGSIVSKYYERPEKIEKEATSRGEMASEFNQTINITVNGSTSPQETAEAINQNLQGVDFGARNMKSPVAP